MSDDLSISDRQIIEEACGQFERFWANASPIRIEDFLSGRPSEKENIRVQLLKELVLIDLEHRIRRHGKKELSESLVNRYVRTFDNLHSLRDELLFHEFRLRQRFGNRPTIDQYAKLSLNWTSSDYRRFQEETTKLSRLRLSIYRSGKLVHECDLQHTTVFGRKVNPDHELFRLFECDGSDHVCIASESQRSVSRRHVVVEPVAFGKSIVRNVSRKNSVRILNRVQRPGTSILVDDPNLLMEVEDIVLKVSSRTG